MLPQPCIDAVNVLMKKKTSEMPLNTQWSEILKVFADHKVSYKLKAHSGMILVHPRNRGGLGLNWHNAHRNGRKIVGVGGDLAELKNAICFELSTNTLIRNEQIDFNKELVKSANGLLAEVNGSERFLSIGAGHCAGFCRAANARTPTPEKKLQDKDGRIDTPRITHKDPVLKEMIEEGWEWLVLPACVELQWPKIAGSWPAGFELEAECADENVRAGISLYYSRPCCSADPEEDGDRLG